MAHDIFISYAAEDKRIADAVCEAIESEGLRCWYAPRDVEYGQDFEESIVDAICASSLIVLILTARSNTSAHVKREVQNACMEGVSVPVLPFRVEDVLLNKALRYYIGSVHWLDAVTPPLETHLKRLVEHVRARIPRQVLPSKELEVEEAIAPSQAQTKSDQVLAEPTEPIETVEKASDADEEVGRIEKVLEVKKHLEVAVPARVVGVKDFETQTPVRKTDPPTRFAYGHLVIGLLLAAGIALAVIFPDCGWIRPSKPHPPPSLTPISSPTPSVLPSPSPSKPSPTLKTVRDPWSQRFPEIFVKELEGTKWQGTDSDEQISRTYEFLPNGKVRMSAQGVTIDGTWTYNGTIVQMNLAGLTREAEVKADGTMEGTWTKATGDKWNVKRATWSAKKQN